MQIQYELLRTTSKRIFESYMWYSRQIKNSWKISPYTLHVQHTFLYISLPLFCMTTTWNVQKLLSYTFNGGNVIRVLLSFFLYYRPFSPCIWLVAARISHFVTAATKCLCCSFNQKISPFFISRSRSLSPFFSLSFAGLPPAFLLLYILIL